MSAEPLPIPGFENLAGSDVYMRQRAAGRDVLRAYRRTLSSIRTVAQSFQDAARRIPPDEEAGKTPLVVTSLDELILHFTPETHHLFAEGGRNSERYIARHCEPIDDRDPYEDIEEVVVQYGGYSEGLYQKLTQRLPPERQPNLLVQGLSHPLALIVGQGMHWVTRWPATVWTRLPLDWGHLAGEIVRRTINSATIGPIKPTDAHRVQYILDPIYPSMNERKQLDRLLDHTAELNRHELLIVGAALLQHDRPDAVIVPTEDRE